MDDTHENNQNNNQQQANTLNVYTDGPYNTQKQELDATYQKLFQPGQEDLLLNFEMAKPLSQLALNGTKTYQNEYRTLRSVCGYKYADVKVPGVKAIDASFVKTAFQETSPGDADGVQPYGLMIACDGYNMGSTINFWTLVIQQNVTRIVSFNERFARGRDKQWCDVYQYFADEREGQFDVGNNFVIILDKENVQYNDSMTIRPLKVMNAKTQKVIHSVEHIHYHAWEDFSVPESEAMNDLINIMQKQVDLIIDQTCKRQRGETQNQEKILMHCLAGRGRTGTALAIVNAMLTLQWQIMNIDQSKLGTEITADNIRDHLHLSVFSIVRRLREQRYTAVQAQEQYSYIYQIVNAWLINKINDINFEPQTAQIQEQNQ